ncbi:hypothetical protein HK105_206948 [Polyrhizophydium stewartii]|uniref:Uncharacterized protein n=1 Tax=Polyrhizophydium stewartii TaxID=2732419 RepID=A0ABR4N1Y3_9FUNG
MHRHSNAGVRLHRQHRHTQSHAISRLAQAPEFSSAESPNSGHGRLSSVLPLLEDNRDDLEGELVELLGGNEPAPALAMLWSSGASSDDSSRNRIRRRALLMLLDRIHNSQDAALSHLCMRWVMRNVETRSALSVIPTLMHVARKHPDADFALELAAFVIRNSAHLCLADALDIAAMLHRAGRGDVARGLVDPFEKQCLRGMASPSTFKALILHNATFRAGVDALQLLRKAVAVHGAVDAAATIAVAQALERSRSLKTLQFMLIEFTISQLGGAAGIGAVYVALLSAQLKSDPRNAKDILKIVKGVDAHIIGATPQLPAIVVLALRHLSYIKGVRDVERNTSLYIQNLCRTLSPEALDTIVQLLLKDSMFDVVAARKWFDNYSDEARARSAGAPLQQTIRRLMHAYGRIGDVENMKRTFDCLPTYGYTPENADNIVLLSMLSKNKHLNELDKVIEALATGGGEITLDVLHVMIYTFLRTGQPKEAMHLLRKLPEWAPALRTHIEELFSCFQRIFAQRDQTSPQEQARILRGDISSMRTSSSLHMPDAETSSISDDTRGKINQILSSAIQGLLRLGYASEARAALTVFAKAGMPLSIEALCAYIDLLGRCKLRDDLEAILHNPRAFAGPLMNSYLYAALALALARCPGSSTSTIDRVMLAMARSRTFTFSGADSWNMIMTAYRLVGNFPAVRTLWLALKKDFAQLGRLDAPGLFDSRSINVAFVIVLGTWAETATAARSLRAGSLASRFLESDAWTQWLAEECMSLVREHRIVFDSFVWAKLAAEASARNVPRMYLGALEVATARWQQAVEMAGSKADAQGQSSSDLHNGAARSAGIRAGQSAGSARGLSPQGMPWGAATLALGRYASWADGDTRELVEAASGCITATDLSKVRGALARLGDEAGLRIFARLVVRLARFHPAPAVRALARQLKADAQ